MSNKAPNAKTLSGLLVMQAMLRQMKHIENVFSFVCRGLIDVPGVKSAHHEANKEKSKENENVRSFPLHIGEQDYGLLSLELSDESEFNPYSNYIQNLAFMIVVILEERRLNTVANNYKQDLEAQVTLRTAELKKAEKNALKEQERAERYLEVSEAMVVELDKDAHITVINERGCCLLGYPREDLLGKNWFDIAIPEEERQAVKDVFSKIITGETETSEYHDNDIVSKSGKCLHIAWHNVLLFDETGKINGSLSSGIDITARLQLEELTKRTERLESISVLAGGVAHDLNNLIGPLVILPDLIKDDINNIPNTPIINKQQILESLEVTSNSALRAAAVVKDLLTLGRRRRYELQSIDFNACVSDCINQESLKVLIRPNKKATIVNKITDASLLITGETSSLSRVITNLVQNAIESIQKKGIITVETSSVDLKRQHTGHEIIPAGKYAMLSVNDTGSGIKEEYLPRVFEAFFSQKARGEKSGSGLGLAVVHGIVKDHDGYLDVVSREGKGSTFSLYLPLAKEDKIQQNLDSKIEATARTGNILVVDDEPGQRFIAKRGLKKAGYNVTEAVDGHETLKIFKNEHNKKKSQPFDLMILDMIMEDGFDGLDTLSAVLELYPHLPVIIASGHAENDRSAAAIKLGATWMPKPYNLNDLLIKVSAKLG